jgi:hypothetical protein
VGSAPALVAEKPGAHTQAVKPALDTAFASVQGVQALVLEPVAEYVLGRQDAITAFAVVVQAVTTRLPGPVVAQVAQAQLEVEQSALPVALHVLPAVHEARLQASPMYIPFDAIAHVDLSGTGLNCVEAPEHVVPVYSA